MNLQETIRESLCCVEQDLFTREYNNIYSIYSNTHADKICDDLYVIRGSEFRKCTETLFSTWWVGNKETGRPCVEEFLNKYNYVLLDCDGERLFPIYGVDEDDVYLKPELITKIVSIIRDCEFVIVTSRDNLV